MDYLYSASTNGFYTIDIHGDSIPGDVVKVTADLHGQLLRGQAEGKQIAPDANGLPVLMDRLPPPAAPKTVFSVREFVRRFTVEEQLAIRQAQLTDMEVGLVYDDFNRAEFIDIEDLDVAAGIDLYISKGLLTVDRRTALLASEVPPVE